MHQSAIDTAQMSFLEFYTKNYGRICNYIRSRIPEVGDAEDLAQDVFMKFLEKGIELNSHSVCLLFALARNASIDALRQYMRTRARYTVREGSDEPSENCVDNEVSYRELSHIYVTLIENLSPRRRDIYRKIEIEDKSIPEVSGSMGLNMRTVNNQLYTARQIIRNNMRSLR